MSKSTSFCSTCDKNVRLCKLQFLLTPKGRRSFFFKKMLKFAISSSRRKNKKIILFLEL